MNNIISIVGGFEFTVLQRNLKEWHERQRRMFPNAKGKQQKKIRQLQKYFVSNSVLIISHITFRDCRVHIFSDNLTRNSCIYKR